MDELEEVKKILEDATEVIGIEHNYNKVAAQILTLIKEAGYVKLAENQELPPFIYLSGSDFNAKSTIQQCMLKAGFRKVELEPRKRKEVKNALERNTAETRRY